MFDAIETCLKCTYWAGVNIADAMSCGGVWVGLGVGRFLFGWS